MSSRRPPPQSRGTTRPEPVPSAQNRQLAALLLAAFSGAAVMVVELGVARILTPVFGGSIAVWAIVIATTMLALALGYSVGGYLADRWGGSASPVWPGSAPCCGP